MEIYPIIDPYAVHYDTFAGDVYTLNTAGITLTGGTLTAEAGIFGSLVVDTTTLVVNVAGYTDKVGIGTATPSQALDLIGSLELEDTTTSTTGVIYKGADRFIHNFHHPTGDTAIPVGRNTFIGIDAGNFTMGSTATGIVAASYNVGIGNLALYNNSLGSYNVAIGGESLMANTTGTRNFGLGYVALFSNTTGFENSGIGFAALRYTQTGGNNVAIGSRSGQGVSTNSFSFNTLVGSHSGQNLTTGSSNIFLGYDAGYRQTTLSNRLIVDNQLRANVATELSNAIIYGVMAAAPADQTLRFNANIVVPKTSGMGIKVDSTTPTFGFADLLGDQFSKNTGGTKPVLATYNDTIDAWRFSDGDEAFLSFHIPHDYVPGTDIHLHIHWSQTYDSCTGGTIDFRYSAIYAKGHNQVSGSTFTSDPITDTFSSIDIDDENGGLNQYQHHLTEVVISAASATTALFDRDDLEPDGVIELTFEMTSNNLTGTAVTDPFIHYVDIHYQTTGLIGTKQKAPDFYT